MRVAPALVLVLVVGGCLRPSHLNPVRLPYEGRSLFGVQVRVPPVVDKRRGTAVCSDLTSVRVPDLADAATRALWASLQDADASVVADGEAMYTVRVEIQRTSGKCAAPQIEAAAEIRKGDAVIWSGPVRDALEPTKDLRDERAVSVVLGRVMGTVRRLLAQAVFGGDAAPAVVQATQAQPTQARGQRKLRTRSRLSEPLRVVMLPLTGIGGVSKALTHVAGAYLLSELDAVDGLTTVGADDLEAMLTVDRQKQALGCDTVACLAEIGGALNADAVLRGEIGRLDSSYTITVSLVRTKTASVAARATRTGATSEQEIAEQVPELVDDLVSRLDR